MRVCIVCYSARKIAPYLQFYINELEKRDVEFSFITREISAQHLDQEVLPNQYIIESIHSPSIMKRLWSMLKWRKEVCNYLASESIDKVILLTGYPAIILHSYVLRNYRGKYIIDIRDYLPFFRYSPIKKILKKVLESSAFTVISSDGFRSWLPARENVLTVHNCPHVEKIEQQPAYELKSKSKVRIGYLGVISYLEQNIKLISDLANSEKYSLHYAGVFDEGETLQKHVFNAKIHNVTFGGTFNNTEKKDLYEQIDMINAIYGNNSIVVTSALPNKLYDAILFSKPILVSKGTFLADIVEQYKLGIAVDCTQNILAQIDEYISKFNTEEFRKGAQLLYNKCMIDNKYVIQELGRFLK